MFNLFNCLRCEKPVREDRKYCDECKAYLRQKPPKKPARKPMYFKEINQKLTKKLAEKGLAPTINGGKVTKK